MPNPNNPQVPAGDQQYLTQIQQEEQQQVQQAVQQVAATISGIFGGTTPTSSTGGSGGKFSFSPELIEDQLKQCQQLMQDLASDRATAEMARQVLTPPAADTAGSVMQANAYKSSLAVLSQRILQQQQFVQQWMGTLNKAKQDYLTNEHVTADVWDRLAKGLTA